MNYSIKVATVENLDDIYNLQKDYSHLILSKNSLKKDLESNLSFYLIAITDSNEIVGSIGINLLVDHADISILITKKGYTNLGIATSLLNKVTEKCLELNFEKIFLEVRFSNTTAINLYEKAGFKSISKRKNYYSDTNEDAIIYVKKI